MKKGTDTRFPEIDIRGLENLPIGVMLLDNTQVYFANNHGAKILGISREQQKNPPTIFSFIPKKNHRQVKARLKKILTGAISNPVNELEVLTTKGKKVILETSSNVGWYNGKPVIQTAFSEISERRIKSDEYAQAGEMLRKIRASSVDVIFHYLFVPKLELKLISDSSRAVLGYTPEELYDNPSLITKAILPEDRSLFAIRRSEYEQRYSKDPNFKPIVRFRHTNGQIKHLEIVMNPVKGKDKSLAGIVGSMRDVTERTETERLLIETKEKFDLITNNSNDIIAFYTYIPKEKFLYVSPNISKILGYSVDQLMRDSAFLARRVSSDKAVFEKAEALMKNYQRTNTLRNFYIQYKIKSNSGDDVWLENSIVPIPDKKGKIAFFINILRDITEQKEAEIEIENQYNNYRNLLDKSPVAYVIHDNGVCIYVNNALMKMFKITNKYEVLGKFALDFLNESDRPRIIKKINSVYRNRNPRSGVFTVSVRDMEGNPTEVEISSVRIRFNDRDCILSLVNNISEQQQREKERLKALTTELTNRKLKKEIKERQEVEKTLIAKTAHLSAIFESSSHLIWTVNRDLELTSFNQNYWQVVKEKHNIELKVGDKVHEMLVGKQKEYMSSWYPLYATAFEGNKLEFEKEDYHRNERIYRRVFINPILNERGEVTELSCIANNITDSKIYEQKLINQSGKLSAIFDSSHHYIWTIDLNERLTSFNKNYYDLVMSLYNTKPYTGLILDRGVLANDKSYTEVLRYHYDKAFQGVATSFEIETKDKDHKNVYLEIFLNPIYENGKVVEVSGIAHNITEKKHAQQRIELSLKEKEILLREVHHRVKNNMQVISSILNLQSSYVSDEYALTLLKESQNRINTMAYIHESLYQNKSFSSVNFSDYVHTLVNNIVQSYSYSSEKIRLELKIDTVKLSLDTSIPAGLIINELITNAIKHAFPGKKHGTIAFSLACIDNFVFLELKDDGVGFAPGIDFENNHSLGLQLVNTLIEQIDGELKFRSEPGKGTEIVVKFKL